MEAISDVTERKRVIGAECAKYVASHPQLRQLLHDFVTAVLAEKPSNIPLFARDYFSRFLPDPDAQQSALEAVGEEEAEEEALMKGEIPTQEASQK